MVTDREEANCGSCIFYMPNLRVCRRFPPTPLMVGIKQGIAQISPQEPVILSYYPAMMPNGWCGEYVQIQKSEENN